MSIKETAKLGFGLGIGTFGAAMLYTCVGALFFCIGFAILNREQKKKEEDQSTLMKGVAYVLMFIGMVAGLGFGASTFFNELGANIAG